MKGIVLGCMLAALVVPAVGHAESMAPQPGAAATYAESIELAQIQLNACSAPGRMQTYGSASGATSNLGNNYTGSCAGAGAETVYAWTAPESGIVCADTYGSAFDTVLYVRGNCASDSSEIACNDDEQDLLSQVQFSAQAGQTYYLFVDAYDISESGAFTLNIRAGACGTNTPSLPQVAGVCPSVRGNLSVGATRGSTNAGGTAGTTGSCAASSDAPAHVYTYRPSTSSQVCINTVGSGFDTALYVRSACGDPSSELACNDDTQGLQSEVGFYAQAGQTYYVFVDGYGSNSGDYTVNLRQGACGGSTEICTNGVDDDADGSVDCRDSDCTANAACTNSMGSCSNPMFINPTGAPASGNTAGLVSQNSGTCGGRDAPEAVYTFTLWENSQVCLNTVGSQYDTVLYVRQGVCTQQPAEIACNDDMEGGGLDSQVQFNAIANQTYYVFVDGYGSNAGAHNLHLRLGPCQTQGPQGQQATFARITNIDVHSRDGSFAYCRDALEATITTDRATVIYAQVGERVRQLQLMPGANRVTLIADREGREMAETYRGPINIAPYDPNSGNIGQPVSSNREVVVGPGACGSGRSGPSSSGDAKED